MLVDSPLLACNLILPPAEQAVICDAARTAHHGFHVAAENLRVLADYDIAALDEERKAGR